MFVPAMLAIASYSYTRYYDNDSYSYTCHRPHSSSCSYPFSSYYYAHTPCSSYHRCYLYFLFFFQYYDGQGGLISRGNVLSDTYCHLVLPYFAQQVRQQAAGMLIPTFVGCRCSTRPKSLASHPFLRQGPWRPLDDVGFEVLQGEVESERFRDRSFGALGDYSLHKGGGQNYGPFLDPYYNTAPNI